MEARNYEAQELEQKRKEFMLELVNENIRLLDDNIRLICENNRLRKRLEEIKELERWWKGDKGKE